MIERASRGALPEEQDRNDVQEWYQALIGASETRQALS